MEQKYTTAVAEAVGRPPSQVKQMLRVMREADLVPGHGVTPTSRHIARIVMSMGTDLAGDIVPLVSALQALPLQTPAALPATAEEMLTDLVSTLPLSPVLGGVFDVDDGFVHLGADSLTLECLTVGGHRVCVRYGAPMAGITARVTVPVSAIRNLIKAIRTNS